MAERTSSAPSMDTQTGSSPEALQSRLQTWLGSDGAAAAGCIAGGSPLFPQEEAALGGACAERRAEFAAGRACGRRALTRLGAASTAIPVGPLGRPVWPHDYCGSIAHDSGIVVAVTGRRTTWLHMGVDIQSLDNGLPDDALAPILATPDEPPLAVLPAHRRHAAGSLLFCIKESAIKALSSSVAGWIDFADLRAAATGNRFIVRHCGRPDLAVCGRWEIVTGFVVTLALVSAEAGRDSGSQR
jgi:4'-phosphopantetheinyl transferase EntD